MTAQKSHRINETGIYYHVYNKGIEKRIIFNDDEDYAVFLGYLEDYLASPKDPESVKKVFEIHGRKYRGTPHQPKNYFRKVELIAYNLMPDHFHLLLHQVTRSSLENFIRSLFTRYSIYFNKKYHRSGSLFEGSYKSIPIRDNLHLQHLTRYLHCAGGYSSYPEYLGTRETQWVKPQVVLSLFDKGASSYKDFVDRYKLDQKQKELIDSLTFSDDTACIERSDLTSTVPHFLALSFVILLLLTGFGIRNIYVSGSNRPQSLPTSQILSETEDATPQVQPETTPASTPGGIPETLLKAKVTVRLNDASLRVNIRQEQSTDSAKLGKARDGDTFEFVSKDTGWYEVRLVDGSTGFISADYIIEEPVNN